MLNISKKLFSAFNDAELLYCHWKSNEHLNPGLDGLTDLDILFCQDEKEKLYNILQTHDCIKCVSQYGSRYPGVEDWLGFDYETGKMIHLHVHFQIVTGHTGMKEFCLPWTSKALQTRVKHEIFDVYIMEPNLEFVTLYTRIGLKVSFKDFIKIALGKYRFSIDTQKEIDWLKKRINWNDVERILDAYYEEDAATVIDIMRKEEISIKEIKILRTCCERKFKQYSRVPHLMRLKEIMYFLEVCIINQWKKKHSRTFITKKTPIYGGLTIAFLGQDGAGKTTVTTDIRKWLSWKLDVRYTYLGSGDNYRSVSKAVSHLIPSFFPFFYLKQTVLISLYKNLAKDVLKYIVKGEEYARKGGLQIFDRYPQTKFPGINDGQKIRSSLLPQMGCFGRFFSKAADVEEKQLEIAYSHNPSVVFKLLIPPEESIRRKPENDINIIRQKHEIIKNLEFNNSDVYIIDAMQPYTEELLQIKRIVWQHILK